MEGSILRMPLACENSLNKDSFLALNSILHGLTPSPLKVPPVHEMAYWYVIFCNNPKKLPSITQTFVPLNWTKYMDKHFFVLKSLNTFEKHFLPKSWWDCCAVILQVHFWTKDLKSPCATIESVLKYGEDMSKENVPKVFHQVLDYVNYGNREEPTTATIPWSWHNAMRVVFSIGEGSILSKLLTQIF